MSEPTDIKSVAVGVAALSICESLLIAMGDLEIMKARELTGVLEDAAAVHRGAGNATASAELHNEVVVVIDRIIAAGHSSFRA